jgi:hypothetical protein
LAIAISWAVLPCHSTTCVVRSLLIGILIWGIAFVLISGFAIAQEKSVLTEPHEETVENQAFLEIGGAALVASEASELFWGPERWVHRRVEQISFVDPNVVRRRISVDLEIPGADEAGEATSKWLPLSVLRNWPPVLSFDLHDEEGRTLPLVSKLSTNLLDERVLLGAAEQALGSVPDSLKKHLRGLVHGEGAKARKSLTAIRTSLKEWSSEEGNEVEQEDLDRVVDLAGILVDRTLLWVKIKGVPGERRILKLAYDEPTRKRLSPGRDLLTTMGLADVPRDVPNN